eukprot:scaffold675867_cov75-Prasinocladus_malaysianus.AAC.1
MYEIYGKRLEWSQYADSLNQYIARDTEDLFPGARLYETCAIVGNHGNMVHNSFGPQIDEHE